MTTNLPDTRNPTPAITDSQHEALDLDLFCWHAVHWFAPLGGTRRDCAVVACAMMSLIGDGVEDDGISEGAPLPGDVIDVGLAILCVPDPLNKPVKVAPAWHYMKLENIYDYRGLVETADPIVQFLLKHGISDIRWNAILDFPSGTSDLLKKVCIAIERLFTRAPDWYEEPTELLTTYCHGDLYESLGTCDGSVLEFDTTALTTLCYYNVFRPRTRDEPGYVGTFKSRWDGTERVLDGKGDEELSQMLDEIERVVADTKKYRASVRKRTFLEEDGGNAQCELDSEQAWPRSLVPATICTSNPVPTFVTLIVTEETSQSGDPLCELWGLDNTKKIYIDERDRRFDFLRRYFAFRLTIIPDPEQPVTEELLATSEFKVIQSVFKHCSELAQEFYWKVQSLLREIVASAVERPSGPFRLSEDAVEIEIVNDQFEGTKLCDYTCDVICRAVGYTEPDRVWEEIIPNSPCQCQCPLGYKYREEIPSSWKVIDEACGGIGRVTDENGNIFHVETSLHDAIREAHAADDDDGDSNDRREGHHHDQEALGIRVKEDTSQLVRMIAEIEDIMANPMRRSKM